MKKIFTGVLAIGFFSLAVLIIASRVCVADTLASGPNGQINLIQTQNFNLDDSFSMICYSDMVADCSHQTAQQTIFTQTTTLSFHGAPSGFTIADTKYSLTGVNLNFLYSVEVLGVIGCSDDNVGVGCSAWGSIESNGSAKFPAANPEGQQVYDLHSNDGHARDDGWDVIVIPYPNYASDLDMLTISAKDQSATLDYSTSDFLSYFMGENTVYLELQKEITGKMWGVDYDDNWDILAGSGTYYHNSPNFDKWDGSASLQYTYSSDAPVPVPATILLMGTGLTGLVGARLRRRGR